MCRDSAKGWARANGPYDSREGQSVTVALWCAGIVPRIGREPRDCMLVTRGSQEPWRRHVPG